MVEHVSGSEIIGRGVSMFGVVWFDEASLQKTLAGEYFALVHLAVSDAASDPNLDAVNASFL